MPELGDKARGDAIGKNPTGYYYWVACPVCKEERWANPKGRYETSKNRLRLCSADSMDARRNNFNLESRYCRSS